MNSYALGSASARPVVAQVTPDRALSYWPTPADIAESLLYLLVEVGHARGEGVRVLEPSAGEGHLVRAIRHRLPRAHITAVEPSAERTPALRALPRLDVVESTLEDYLGTVRTDALEARWEPFDLVVMNPPFTLAGRPEAWAEHVLAIYRDPHLVAAGGILGAVVPRIAMTGRSKRVRAIRDLVARHGRIEECDRDAFAPAGAKVSTALMWAQKPCDSPTRGATMTEEAT